MDIHIDLNEVFSWIGKGICLLACLAVIIYPAVMIWIFAGPPDIGRWFRRWHRKPVDEDFRDK